MQSLPNITSCTLIKGINSKKYTECLKNVSNRHHVKAIITIIILSVKCKKSERLWRHQQITYNCFHNFLNISLTAFQLLVTQEDFHVTSAFYLPKFTHNWQIKTQKEYANRTLQYNRPMRPSLHMRSDVKSWDSVSSQDSLETHFGSLGLDVVVLSISWRC